jgi:hypothetical protein
MPTLIEAHRDDIAELCRRFGVRRLRVFGSAARITGRRGYRGNAVWRVIQDDPRPLRAQFDELGDPA